MLRFVQRLLILASVSIMTACTAFPDTPQCSESSECGEGAVCRAAICVALESEPDGMVADSEASELDLGLDAAPDGAARPDVMIAQDLGSDPDMRMARACTPEELAAAGHEFIGTIESPSLSCRHLHTDHPCLPSGSYWMSYGSGEVRSTICDMETLGGGWEAVPMKFQSAEGTCSTSPPMRNLGRCVGETREIRQNPVRVEVGLQTGNAMGSSLHGPFGEFVGLEMDCHSVNQGRFVCPNPTDVYMSFTGTRPDQRRVQQPETLTLRAFGFIPAEDSLSTVFTLDRPLWTLSNLAMGLSYACPLPSDGSISTLAELEVHCRFRAYGGPGGGHLLTRPQCTDSSHCEDGFQCEAQLCIRPPVVSDGGVDGGAPADAGTTVDVGAQDVGGSP